MSKFINRENFEKLIDTIEVYGEQLSCIEYDLLQDTWHTSMTHKDPEILKMFGIQCIQKADLMDCIKLAEDYRKDPTIESNEVSKKVRSDLQNEKVADHNMKKLQEDLKKNITDDVILFKNKNKPIKIN
jgi:hypothetical protein